MPDDVGREIRQLREDLREDLSELKSALAGLLPREVYNARHDALVHRVATVEAEVRALELAHAADVDRLTRAADEARDKAAGWRRWLIGSAILPSAAILVTVALFFLR